MTTKVYVYPENPDAGTVQNGYEFVAIKREGAHVTCKDIAACPYGRHCGTCMYRDNFRTSSGFRKSEEESGVFDWCSLLHIGESRPGWTLK